MRLQQKRGQPFGFRGGDAPPELRDAIEPPALVGSRRSGGELLDEAFGQHALDGSVQRPGTHLHAARRPVGHLLHDGVPMPLAFTEGDEDVQERGRQRQQRLDFRVDVSCHIELRYNDIGYNTDRYNDASACGNRPDTAARGPVVMRERTRWDLVIGRHRARRLALRLFHAWRQLIIVPTVSCLRRICGQVNGR